MERQERIAVVPGSFDPITKGHMDIIRRAQTLFDKVIVLVVINAAKNPCFSLEERVELIRKVTEDIPNVRVDCSRELLAAYAKRNRARVLVKGLRAVSDFEQEVQMAMINSKINPDLDTVFFPSSEKYTYLSSSVAKELARYHANLDEFLPREIIDDVKNKLEIRSDECDGRQR